MQQPSFGANGPHNFKDIFNALLNNGKDAIDNAMAQYPQPLITRMVEDMYANLNNPASGAAAGGIDADKLETMIDSLKEQMKKPLVSKLLAKQIKSTLQKMSDDDIEASFNKMLASRSLDEQMMMRMAFFQLSPMIDQIRVASDDDVAKQIRDMADQIPSRFVAQQIVDKMQQNSAQQAQDAAAKLPTPDAVAGTVHKLGQAASDALDAAAKSADTGSAVEILKQFSENARTIIKTGLGKDQGPKGPGRRFRI